MALFDNFKKKSNQKINNVESSKTNDAKGFKYLDKLIHSGTKVIYLDRDIELKSELLNHEEKLYPQGIPLDIDYLVIEGNGHSIDAKGKARIFHCTGKNITIKNITLKNGHAMPDWAGNVIGGAIRNGGELNIYNTVFSNNSAKSGGAISGGRLNIVNSEFYSNTAVHGSGGAIDSGSILNITDSIFSNNSAYYEGGAINIENCDFNIERCEFHDNTAEEGGAISDRGPSAYAPTFTIYNNVFDIKESIFKNNNAKNLGGAIISRNMLNIHDSEIGDNTCDDEGIIYSWGNIKIFNCKIFNNKSKNIIYNKDSLQIYSTKFEANHAENIIANASKMYISFSDFKENNIDEAIIYTWAQNCTIEKGIFENNLHNDESKNIINKGSLTLMGPKIKDEGKTIDNEGYIFIKNSPPDLFTKISGTGTVESSEDVIPAVKKFDFGYLDKKIHESTTHEIILDEDISFESYEKDFYEGGIELDIDNLIIDGNGKTIDGGGKSRIFIVTGKNITLKNITFKNGCTYNNYDNELNNHGGALRITSNAKLTMKNCNILNNTSKDFGGAIYNSGELTIYKSKLSDNESENHGGAIYNNYGGLNIEKSMLKSNIAGCRRHYGLSSGIGVGAIFNNHGVLNISKSTLLENHANGVGAISNNGQLNISGSILSRNMNGAIFNDEGEISLINSVISDNTVEGDTGAVIHSTDKGRQKLLEFILSGIDASSPTKVKFWNADENKEVLFSGVSLKNCTFKGNEPHDFGRDAIDFEYLNELSSRLGYSVYDHVILNKDIKRK